MSSVVAPVRERKPDMAYVGDAHSVPHGASDPYLVDEQPSLWAGDGQTDESRERTIALAVEYSRWLRRRTIHGPAMFDGRIPEGWTHDQPIPPEALAYGPAGEFDKASDYYSTLLCSCNVAPF